MTIELENIESELNQINSEIESKFNYILISVKIYNYIENSSSFKLVKQIPSVNDGVFFVGYLGEFKCYVDVLSPSNLVTVKYDRQISRNNKIESILSGREFIESIDIEVN